MSENDTTDFVSVAVEEASESLAEAFSALLGSGSLTLGDFEDRALEVAHEAAARAYGKALERRDAELRAALPEGVRAHDRRRRTLATRPGDVTFRLTRCVDRLGLRSCPLLDELGCHTGRGSPPRPPPSSSSSPRTCPTPGPAGRSAGAAARA